MTQRERLSFWAGLLVALLLALYVLKSVLVPYPVDKAYDYGVPDGMEVEAGDYVCVPLGGREVPAVVWGEAAGEVKPDKLKYIIDRYDAAPMRTVHRDFIAWAARYCAAPLGSVLEPFQCRAIWSRFMVTTKSFGQIKNSPSTPILWLMAEKKLPSFLPRGYGILSIS